MKRLLKKLNLHYSLKDYKFSLVILVLILSVCGVFMVRSARPDFMNNQIMGVILGLAAMAVISLIDYKWILNLYWPLYAVNLILLAVLPTVVSNITLVLAVQNIGGTLTSVLGALEPMTAVCIGALVFGEDFTLREGFGILLVLIAVTVIILTGTIQGTINKVFRKIEKTASRPRHA